MKRIYSLLALLFIAAALIKTSAQVYVSSSGGSSTTATYASLAAAFNAINTGTVHTGTVNVRINSSLTETLVCRLNKAANACSSITIRPADSATVTKTITNASAGITVLKLTDSSHNITIDGRAGGTGSTSRLAFVHTNVNANSHTVQLDSGAYSNTIKYTTMSNVGSVNTTYCLSLVSGSASRAMNNNTINNNTISGGLYPMFVNLYATTGSTNLVVSNNQINNGYQYQMYLVGGISSGTIDSNQIFFNNGYYSGNTQSWGIVNTNIVTGSTLNITRNHIYNIRNNRNDGGANSIYGINVTNITVALTINIRNNMIELTDSNYYVYNIRGISVGTTGAFTCNVDYNTVRIGGILHPSLGGAGYVSRVFDLQMSSTTKTLRVRNNLFSNERLGGRDTTLHIAAGYFQVGTGPAWGTTTGTYSIENNIYKSVKNWYNGAPPFVAMGSNGYIWSTYSSGYKPYANPYDQTSDFYSSLNFTSSTNSHLTGGSVQDPNLIGLPVSGVTNDLDNDTRASTYPYKGADETTAFSTNDAAVLSIYTMGRNATPFGNPNIISTQVKNTGVATITNLKVYLQSTGANSFLDSVTIGSLAAQATSSFDFPAHNFTTKGNNSITVFVPNDNINTNNSKTANLTTTANSFNYGDFTQAPSGGVGFTGGTGDFVAKFKNSDTNALINQISVYFNTGNDSVQIGIWAQDTATKKPGSLLWASSTFKAPVGPVLQVISVPNINVKGTFFCGVKQIKTTNIGFAYQSESPIRDSTFFYTAPTGATTWTDFNATASPYKFMIEPRLKLQNDIGMTTLVNPSGCIDGQNQTVKMRLLNLGYDTVKFASHNVTIKSWAILPNSSQNNFSDVVISSGMLLPDSSVDVTITNSFDMTTGGNYKFRSYSVYSLDPNDVNDSMPLTTFNVIANNSLPFNQDFNSGLGIPTGWNLAGATTAIAVTASIGSGSSNGLRGVQSTTNLTVTATLPKVGVATSTTQLDFDYKCTNVTGGGATTLSAQDSIKIQISTDCGINWTTLTTINGGNHTATTNFTTKSVSLSAYSGQKFILRVMGVTTGSTTNNYNLDLDNFSVYNPVPMTLSSTVFEQTDFSNVATATTNAIIGRMKYTTNGQSSPLNVSSISMATSGSTNPAVDISNAKIWYTGNSNVFSTATQFGSTVSSPNGAFTVSPGSPQTLRSGINYFWITYDLPSTATIGNKLDIVHNSSVVSGITKTSTPSSVTGNREISYCLPVHTNACGTNYFNGVRINTLNNQNTGCGNSAGNAWTSYYTNGSLTTTLRGGNTYQLTVKNDQVASIVSIWIDYDRSNTYDASEWQQVSTNLLGNDSATINITIPNTVTAGVTGMRIRSANTGSTNNSGSACTTFASGETEEYKITLSSGCNWTGTADTLWSNPANWASNSIPTSIDNVYIPNVTNLPSVTSTSNCKNILIGTGSTLNIRTGGNLIINGTLTDSGAIVHTGGRLTFNAANTVPAGTYHYLVFNAAATYTLAGNIAVNNYLVLNNASAVLNLNGKDITCPGDVNNSGTLSGSGKLIISRSGSYPSIIGTGSYQNLELNSGASVGARVTNNCTINGTLTLTQGTLLINSGITLTVGSAGSNSGDIVTVAGTIGGNGGTVKLLGNAAASKVTGLSISSLSNFELNRPNGADLGQNSTITGTLTLTNGILDMAGKNLNLGKTSASTISVVTTNNGRITNNSSTGTLSLLGNASASAISNLRLDSMVALTFVLPAGASLGQGYYAKGLQSITSGDIDLNSFVVNFGPSASLSELADQNFKGSTGYLTTVRNLTSSLSTTNIAGFGPKLTTNQAPGNTTIIRGHTVQTSGGGNSIKRYYTFQPTNYSGMVAALELVYDASELNGATRQYLRLNQSNNGGSSWNTLVGGSRTTAASATGFVQHANLTIAASGSMFTGSDSVNSPLTPILANEPMTGIKTPFGIHNLYPNPFSSEVTIQFDANTNGSALLTLTDLQGRNVATQKIAASEGMNKHTISNLGEIANGLYLLTINVGSEIRTMKVVKE